MSSNELEALKWEVIARLYLEIDRVTTEYLWEHILGLSKKLTVYEPRIVGLKNPDA